MIYNTSIHENYALSMSVGEIFDVATTSILTSSQVYLNEVLTKAEVLEEINGS
jgi:hypothetical protein